MSKLDTFIQHAVNAVPVSGTSLISSLYGDSLSHRGGEIWLGSLAALLEGLGFGERFVRTALFRLNKEGWLVPASGDAVSIASVIKACA